MPSLVLRYLNVTNRLSNTPGRFEKRQLHAGKVDNRHIVTSHYYFARVALCRTVNGGDWYGLAPLHERH